MSLCGIVLAKPICRISNLIEWRANYAVQSVKPHVPLIKFRKGGPVASAGGSSAGSIGGSLTSRAGGLTVVSQGTIEDYLLPKRYHRQPLDEKEIDYINRGGPE